MDFFSYYGRVLATALSQSIDTAQAIIFVIIIAAGIITYLFPGVKMTADFNGWQVAAIVLGLIVVVRLLLAPYWNWKDDQAATSAIQTKNSELQAKLDDREHKRRVKIALGGFLEEGRQLMIRCADESQPVPTDDANGWANKTENFIHENMDDSFIPRFRDGSGLPMTATSITSMPHSNLWMGIWVRTSRLQEFIKEYGN